MELTKEHFEKHLSEQLGEIHNRLDNITITMVTKDELKAQTKELQDYTDQVAETIIEAVDSKVNKLEKRIVILETVK